MNGAGTAGRRGAEGAPEEVRYLAGVGDGEGIFGDALEERRLVEAGQHIFGPRLKVDVGRHYDERHAGLECFDDAGHHVRSADARTLADPDAAGSLRVGVGHKDGVPLVSRKMVFYLGIILPGLVEAQRRLAGQAEDIGHVISLEHRKNCFACLHHIFPSQKILYRIMIHHK